MSPDIEVPKTSGRRLHIVILIKTNRGGKWLVPQVAALVAKGHRVSAVVADEDGPLGTLLLKAGVEVSRSPALGGRGARLALFYLPALFWQVRNAAPDALNYHLYRSALIGRLVGMGSPRTARVHSVAGPLFLESDVIQRAEKFLSRLDDVIIGSSRAVVSLYSAVATPSSKVTLVPYPLDLASFTPITRAQRAEARRRLGLPEDAFVVVMIAYFYAPKRLTWRGLGIKGHDVLLDAWKLFRQSGGDGYLLVVGGGFGIEGDEYRASLIESSGLSADERVRFVDSVDDVRLYYASASVSAAPSRSENLGSAAEASAFGVPTIGSEVGGLPELVLHDETGWLVAVGDQEALASRLLECSALTEDRLRLMGDAARMRAEEIFAPSATIDRYVEVIENSVEKRFR